MGARRRSRSRAITIAATLPAVSDRREKLPARAVARYRSRMQGQVRAEALSKTYRVGFFARRVRAVEDLSFEVRAGEIFGLLGPNGAGKTTTIKMLLGFVRPTRGRAFIGAAPAGSLQARRDLGYLPENPALYEFL